MTSGRHISKLSTFKVSLTFGINVPVSSELQDLLIQYCTFGRIGSPLTLIDRSSSPTDAKVRFGRHGTKEIMQHPSFDGTMWKTLHSGAEAFSLLLVAIPHASNRAPSP